MWIASVAHTTCPITVLMITVTAYIDSTHTVLEIKLQLKIYVEEETLHSYHNYENYHGQLE